MAASGYREVHRPTFVSAFYHRAFEGLEPVDWKLSNPVLRGRRAGNSPLLPDVRHEVAIAFVTTE